MTTRQAFAASLEAEAPPAGASTPMAALWWVHRGDWEAAHRIVQDAPGPEAAWVHAHLHRVEGDLGNAAYWYRRAHRAVPSGDLETERASLVAALCEPEQVARRTQMD